MKCDYCEIAKKKLKSEIVYEDNQIIAVVKDLAAIPGQICVFPKEHYTIIEFVPNDVINHLFRVVNKVSVALFETLGIQGTNIIVQNGTAAGQKVPHFCVEVIPRKENDGLNLDWKAKQFMEDEMDTAYLLLKEEGEQLVVALEEKKEIVIKDKKTEVVLEKEGEDNYLLKQLKRVP